MPWLAIALALAASAAPPGGPVTAPGAAPGALSALASGLATRLGGPEEGRRSLALALTAQPAPLGAPLSAALSAALGQAGWAVSLVAPGPGAEAAARAAAADWLLTLAAGGGADGTGLVAVGQAVPLWLSFFLQARPGVRAAPPRVVSARAPADPEARLLLGGGGPGGGGPPDLARLSLRRIAGLSCQVVGLAAGEVDGVGPAILAVCPDAVRLLGRTGLEVASRALDATARHPVRLPAASAVVAPLGSGSLGVALAGATGGEVLVRRGARLERAATLPMAPLAAGEAAVLFGAFAPGKAALQDLLTLGVDPGARPRSTRELVAVAAAPRGSAPAFAALHPGGRLELLDAALGPAGEVPGVGAGFALADLDGDGRSELVASNTGPGSPDGVRVLRLGGTSSASGASKVAAHPERGVPSVGPSGPEPRGPEPRETPAAAFESPAIDGAITSAAAADLTGDGLDDVLLAAVRSGAGGITGTDLWLLTLDPREAR